MSSSSSARSVRAGSARSAPAVGRAPVGRARRFGTGPAVLTAVGAVLSVLAVGVPGAVMLLGVTALATALRRRADWSVLSSLAGAVLLSVASMAAGLVAAAALSSGPLGRSQAWVVLLLPLLLTTVLLALDPTVRRGAASAPDDSGERSFLVPMAVAMLGVLAAALVVDLVTDGFGPAWAMSGDGRNHVKLARGVVAQGGVSVAGLRAYPVLYNGLLAVHAVATSAPDGPGAMLAHDVRSLAAMYVLTTALVTGLVAAAAAQLVGRVPGGLSAGGLGGHLVATGAGVLVLCPLLLSTALADGFYTGIAAVALLVAGLVTAVHGVVHRSPEAAVVSGGAGLLLLMVWPPLALVSAPLAGVAAAALLRGPRATRTSVAGIASLLLALAPFAAVVLTRGTLAEVLRLPGFMTRPSTLLLLALVVVLAVAGRSGHASPGAVLVTAVAAAAGVVLVAGLARLGDPPASWTYYASKSLWLVESALLPVALLPAAWSGLRPAPVGEGRRVSLRRHATTAALVVGAVAVTGMATPLAPALARAAAGWDQPSTTTAQAVMDVGDERVPYVFWRYSVPSTFTGDDRIANFWATSVWALARDGSFLYTDGVAGGPLAWAYTAGTTADLCTLAAGVPGLTVRTRDAALVGELADTCPSTPVDVRVSPAA